MKAIWKKKLDLRCGGRYWILSIYFVIENSIKQPKNDFGRKNKLDNQFTLGPTTQPTLVQGLGFSWGHGNFGNNIRNMSQSIRDKIIKLTTTWNINWKHIGNTNMNTIGNMWGDETRKLLSQLLLTPLEPLLHGAWAAHNAQKFQKLSYYFENAKISQKIFSNWYDFMNFIV
jgi:hypothetical protein